MFLIKIKNPKLESQRTRWIKLHKQFYAIKQLTNKEKEVLLSSDNIEEMYKSNRHSLTIYKSLENKMFVGMEI
jgi:hypothetical protein